MQPIREMEREAVEKIRKEGAQIRNEVREKTLGYIVGALGIVAGLAWNEAVKAAIEHLFPLGKDTLTAQFVYAIVMTLFVVVVTIYLMKFLGKKQEATNPPRP